MTRWTRTVCVMAALALLASGCRGGARQETRPEQQLPGRWEGEWSGSTAVPQCTQDRLALDIRSVEGNRFEADVQGGCGGQFPASGELSGRTLKLSGEAALGSLTYEGSLSADGQEMSGTWEVPGSPFRGTWRARKVAAAASPEVSPPAAEVRPSPEATTTPAAGPTAAEELPVPPGAALQTSLQVSAPAAPLPAPVSGEFTRWTMRTYRVDRRPEEVVRFYQQELRAPWRNTFTVQQETPTVEAVLVYQREQEGKKEAVVIQVRRTESGEASTLVVWHGQ